MIEPNRTTATIRFGACHNEVEFHKSGTTLSLVRATHRDKADAAKVLCLMVGIRGATTRGHHRHNHPQRRAAR